MILRKFEKKQLYRRITEFVGKKLLYKKENEKWTFSEISDLTGVPNNRITECVKFDKYKRPIGEKILVLFLGGEIVSISELKQYVASNEKEYNYLDSLLIYEDKKLREMVKQIKKAGHNPAKILDDFLKKNL